MGWNLPPGCTDKDIDDAAQGPQEYQDMRRESIWLERSLHEIESLCDELCGKGYEQELRKCLDEIAWNHNWLVRHYKGEEAE